MDRSDLRDLNRTRERTGNLGQRFRLVLSVEAAVKTSAK